MRTVTKTETNTFRSSSMVEQLAVNELAGGSSPSFGARYQPTDKAKAGNQSRWEASGRV